MNVSVTIHFEKALFVQNNVCISLEHIDNIEGQIRRGRYFFSPQYLSYYPTKPYDVCTQKNRPNETILLSFNIIA